MSYPNDHFIVETDWLAAHLEDPDLRILDCSVDVDLGEDGSWVFSPARDTYRSGHVPGATFVDFEADASDPASALPFMLPPADAFGAAMRRHGVGENCRVIVYDKLANNWSARLWWTLRAYGFTNAAVLNGGLVKWQLEGRPLSTEPVTPPPGDFEPRTDRSGQDVFVGRDRVLAAMEDERTCLIDALDADHYAGRDPTGPARPGHIPTAVSLPWLDVVDMDTHAYLPPEELGPALGRLGLDPDDPVLAYCGAGIGSSQVTFAMVLMGYENLSIYDGSLLDWAADPALPLEVA